MRDFLIAKIAERLHLDRGMVYHQAVGAAELAYETMIENTPSWCFLIDDPEGGYLSVDELMSEYVLFYGSKKGERVDIGIAAEFDRRSVLVDPYLDPEEEELAQ